LIRIAPITWIRLTYPARVSLGSHLVALTIPQPTPKSSTNEEGKEQSSTAKMILMKLHTQTANAAESPGLAYFGTQKNTNRKFS
jgi:hypothetical protein